MLVVDSNRLLCLSAPEVAALGPSKLSDPAAFECFAEILDLSEEVILEAARARFAVATTKDVFDTVILDLLPKCADAEKLVDFDYLAIRITGIGEYCLASVGGRLVAFDALPTDGATGEEVLSFEIAPDVFLAYCRGLLLELSDRIIEDDDELDDVALSDAELDLYGVHGGLAGPTLSVGDGHCADNEGGCIGNLTVAGGCYANRSACAGNLVVLGGCYANATGCADKIFIGGGCFTNASACVAAIGIGGACAANASACTADGSIGFCGANASACAGNAVIGLCGGNAMACAGNVGVGNVGLNVGACAGKASGIDLSPVDLCAGRACGVDLSVIPCPADVCLINFFPILPSC